MLGAEAERLNVVRLPGHVVGVAHRVAYRARLVLREAAVNFRRHGRHVRDRDALLLALPGRGEPGELLAVDERHRPRLRVEVVDAGYGRVRVRERQPPMRPVPSRHLADEEIVGIKRDVESVGLVEPHFPAHAPPHCEQQRVRDGIYRIVRICATSQSYQSC